MAETTYIVLRLDEIPDSKGWAEIARVTAPSASSAIRNALVGPVARDGTYVAVPARSWRPVTVQAVQTTVLRLEEATTPSPGTPPKADS